MTRWTIELDDEVAERPGVATINTLNERDFRVVRPQHVEAFTLLP